MCPIPSSAEVVAIQEGGHHGNRIFCGWHVELPISYLLENNDFECMKHLDQGFRFPFLKIRVTNTEFRRRAVPGMGPSTSDSGSISEVSLNFDKIHQKNKSYLRFFLFQQSSLNTSATSSTSNQSDGNLSECGPSNAIVARRPEGLPAKKIPATKPMPEPTRRPEYSLEQRMSKVEGRLKLLEAWKLR